VTLWLFAPLGIANFAGMRDRCDRDTGQDIFGQPAGVIPPQRGEPGREAGHPARPLHAASSDHHPCATVMQSSEHSPENVPTPDLTN
jgi:hypothetical protein